MKCLHYASEMDLVQDTRDLPYTYKGETTLLPAVTGDFCPACGEAVLNLTESSRVSAAMLEFNRQVNASIVDPALIVSIRKKLALDQREAAEIFGGGVNAFSRYGKLLRELSFLEGKYAKVYYENERLRNEVTQLLEKEWEDVK